MTAIVGIEAGDGRVFLAADSCEAAEGDYLTTLTAGQKLGRFKHYGMGFAGLSRAIQVYRHELSIPKPPKTRKAKKVEEWLVRELVAALFEIGKTHDILAPRNRKSEIAELEVEALIGVRGFLFHLSSCGAVSRDACGHNATGSGRSAALVAMDVLAGFDLEPDAKVLRALDHASFREPFVTPPFAPLWVEA